MYLLSTYLTNFHCQSSVLIKGDWSIAVTFVNFTTLIEMKFLILKYCIKIIYIEKIFKYQHSFFFNLSREFWT